MSHADAGEAIAQAGASGRAPRVLVTGFGPFPGAPVNPSAGLAGRFRMERARLAGHAVVRAEVLETVYQAVPARLAALGRTFDPDIAVHFGLGRSVRGFRIEALARNRIEAGTFDAAGRRPGAERIREGGPAWLAGSAPLGAIVRALGAAGLPVEVSHDAGGYLCNYLFYLSAGGAIAGFRPTMTGFVHVPPLHAAGTMGRDALWRGARTIVACCIAEWHARRSARRGRVPCPRNI